MKKFLSAAAVLAIASGASAGLIYSTSFESPFVVGNLNGQQNWLADAGTVANTAGNARTGTQYAQMTGSQIGTTAKWAWNGATSLSAAQLAVNPIVRAGVWTAQGGNLGTRTITAGLDLYDSNVARIGLMYIGSDGSVSVLDGNGLGGSLAAGSVVVSQYHHLEIEANYSDMSVKFYIDNTLIYTGTHVSSDFGDADIRSTRSSTGTGGTTYITAYDDYTIENNAIPAPGALALVGLGGLVAGRRRR
ncbi:MAG: PEP-CTERM sorting domain-containing protein [Phycisphaerales bacterium]|nr:PEP-CTERM sorting domain-containing protein [Planctomycetota bacterium]